MQVDCEQKYSRRHFYQLGYKDGKKDVCEGIVKCLEKKINPLHNVNWNSAIEEAIEIVKEVGGIND